VDEIASGGRSARAGRLDEAGRGERRTSEAKPGDDCRVHCMRGRAKARRASEGACDFSHAGELFPYKCFSCRGSVMSVPATSTDHMANFI